jgi:hypothetical protein
MDPSFCNLLATVPLRDVAPAFSHLITTTSDGMHDSFGTFCDESQCV